MEGVRRVGARTRLPPVRHLYFNFSAVNDEYAGHEEMAIFYARKVIAICYLN